LRARLVRGSWWTLTTAFCRRRLLFNEYGPTEATVWSSVYECEPGETGPTVPIGRPITNTQLYVLDRNLQPVPFGVSGELYIGGDGVARGYVNRPDLTELNFIPNPSPKRPALSFIAPVTWSVIWPTETSNF